VEDARGWNVNWGAHWCKTASLSLRQCGNSRRDITEASEFGRHTSWLRGKDAICNVIQDGQMMRKLDGLNDNEVELICYKCRRWWNLEPPVRFKLPLIRNKSNTRKRGTVPAITIFGEHCQSQQYFFSIFFITISYPLYVSAPTGHIQMEYILVNS
jgi:hypothetical protein